MINQVEVIDSHTGGEPTRVILSGGPDLGTGSLAERRARFASEHDRFRRAMMNEPRGNDILVGALLCPPSDPSCTAGVIFFNNVGVLGMCGHGTIGLAVTLAYLGQMSVGNHRLETPVGQIDVRLHDDQHQVTFTNVPSFRLAKSIPIQTQNYGRMHGDIAWGGNWFFLVSDHGQTIRPDRIDTLLDVTSEIKTALHQQKITGKDGAEIDHIELVSDSPSANARTFVLCPGGQWDRSPCGTGTSAKLACLAADGLLAPGQRWVQESVIGSQFEASYQESDSGTVIPSIAGGAWLTGQARLLLDSQDPYCWGVQ